MKRRHTIAILMAAAIGIGFSAFAGEHPHHKSKEKKKAQTTCPVMGGKINKAQYADVEGKRIYVCCPACVAKVKANPDKYIKKLEAEGVKIAKTPKKGEAKKGGAEKGGAEKSHDHSGHNH